MTLRHLTRVLIKPSNPLLGRQLIENGRSFFDWLNIMFNNVDKERINQLGPDRACAEWLLRNGAAIQWVGCNNYLKDYNCLQRSNGKCNFYIEKVDASSSSISHYGFLHFRDCNYIREIILHNCGYIENEALRQLKFVKNTLEHLKVSHCGNITDTGLMELKVLSNLKVLEFEYLPYVKEKELVVQRLKDSLPDCKIITDFEKRKEIKTS